MPGEREIAFVTDHGSGAGYWSVNAETGQERPLFLARDLPKPPGGVKHSRPRLPATLRSLGISAGWRWRSAQNGVLNLWVASLRDARPDGRLMQRTFEREGGSHPAWSPDGRWIAYRCNDGTDTHVCVTGAERGDGLQLTHEPGGQSSPGGWTPDSDHFLFAARRLGVWNVAMVSRSTSKVETLTNFRTPRLYIRDPKWDQANNRVVFERSETTGRIWSVDLP